MNAAYSALRLDEGVKALFAHMAETTKLIQAQTGPLTATDDPDGWTYVTREDGSLHSWAPTDVFNKIVADYRSRA